MGWASFHLFWNLSLFVSLSFLSHEISLSLLPLSLYLSRPFVSHSFSHFTSFITIFDLFLTPSCLMMPFSSTSFFFFVFISLPLPLFFFLSSFAFSFYFLSCICLKSLTTPPPVNRHYDTSLNSWSNRSHNLINWSIRDRVVPLESRAAPRCLALVRAIIAERPSTFSSPRPPPRVALWVFCSPYPLWIGEVLSVQGISGAVSRELGPNRAAVPNKKQAKSEHLAQYQPNPVEEVQKVRAGVWAALPASGEHLSRHFV